MHFMNAVARSGLDARYAVGNLPDARGGDPIDKETDCYNQGAGERITSGYKRTIKMPITTALYAGLLGLVALSVAFAAARLRGQLKVSVGDGGNPQLLCAMRRHANFAEWVPLALILIALLELNGVPSRAIHCLGAALVVSRVCHAIGIRADSMKSLPRFIGATGTVLVTVIASVWLIILYIRH
jgi:uncharacterized membrane protein YecN with MAPEG domain